MYEIILLPKCQWINHNNIPIRCSILFTDHRVLDIVSIARVPERLHFWGIKFPLKTRTRDYHHIIYHLYVCTGKISVLI